MLSYIDYAVAKIERHRERTVPCRVKGQMILLDVETEIEEYRAETYETKEPETLEWIERFFQPQDVIYDVGANIGLYSLFAAKRLRSQCKIYAFEPESLNYAKLNKNIYINGLSGVIVPCCLAVSDSLGFDYFNIHPNIFLPEQLGEGLVAGSALHGFGMSEDYAGKQFKPVHRQGSLAVSLDCLWGTFGLDFPNHIKIDVDGLEGKIIRGADRTLGDSRLKTILIEISSAQGERDPILEKLAKAGFVSFTDFAAHSSEQHKGTAYEQSVNTVFVRS